MQPYEFDAPESPNPFRPPWHIRLFAAIVQPLLRAAQWIIWPLRALGDRLVWFGGMFAEAIEFLLVRCGGWVAEAWWRLTGRLRLDAFATGLFQRIGGLLAATLQRVGNAWNGFLAWAEQSWLTSWLTAPLRWLTRGLYAAIDFAVGWIWTRQYGHLLYGLPAILLIMPLAYSAVRLPFFTTEATARMYRRAADEALGASDYGTAELYFRKLAQLGDTHGHVILRSAMLAQQQGNLEEAYRQIRQLAPLNAPGLAEAHLWIAQQISAGEIERGNPLASELVETHLRHARAQQPDDQALNVWLAQVYFVAGRHGECRRVLEQTRLNELPWLTRLSAADMLAQIGHLDRARSEALGAQEYYRQQHERGTKLTVDEYLAWGLAGEINHRPADALDAMLAGLDQYPDNARLRDAVLDVGLPYVDHYPTDTNAAWQQRFAVLQQMLKAIPDHEPLLRRVAELTLIPPVADVSQQILRDQQSTGPLPAAVEKTLGDTAVMRGDRATARQHYRRALERDPQFDGALNNLAYLLAHDPPLDLTEALALADRAVALQPGNPHYRETRGQILMQLARWQPAVDELTLALNGLPDKREIHASLAKAYVELGQEDTAKLHAERAGR